RHRAQATRAAHRRLDQSTEKGDRTTHHQPHLLTKLLKPGVSKSLTRSAWWPRSSRARNSSLAKATALGIAHLWRHICRREVRGGRGALTAPSLAARASLSGGFGNGRGARRGCSSRDHSSSSPGSLG